MAMLRLGSKNKYDYNKNGDREKLDSKFKEKGLKKENLFIRERRQQVRQN